MINELKKERARKGRLRWIGLRSSKKSQIHEVDAATVDTEDGLVGDHYSKKGGDRMVTLIQAEHLDAVSSFLGKPVKPELTRRNLVVEHINLLSLRDNKFKIGEEVVLEGTGLCHPCSRMEENLGYGGYNAMRGHGGITARVVRGGTIKLGDVIDLEGH